MLRGFTLTAYRHAVLLLLCLLLAGKAGATHMYGADLYYTHISGNKYKVSLYIYGDCSGSAFPNLPGNPVVQVRNGNSLYRTMTLKVEPPTNGLEVTPVCPAQKNNTKCSSLTNTIPGVKRFIYSDTVTLNTTSANWRFRFTGAMGSTSAGRSNSITNIGNNTTMNLEARLNNTSVNNSSPTYTTIPTPFFCINKEVNYNNGAVDADGDSLVYSLVPGLNNSGTVTYNTGYSATSPLAVTTGSFSFSNTTGQLAFLPNMIQRSLVVIRVDEYRNGTLIGTSMREMTIIIYSCGNNPPGGVMSNNNIGTIDSTGRTISVCKPADTLRFSINPADADTADSITMTYTGLPSGAITAISNNNTTGPSSTFTWKISNVAPGSYMFFVTYLDDGCPLVSKQTLAYTVNILPEPDGTVNIVSPATCTKKAVISMTPESSPNPWQIQVRQGSSIIHNFNNVTTTQVDSLIPGSYVVRFINTDSCFWDTSIVINAPPAVGLSSVVDDVKCYGDTSGKVTLAGTAGTTPYRYKINSGSYTTATVYSGLSAGNYTFTVIDSNDCTEDTSITIAEPNQLVPHASVKQSTCEALDDGRVILSATGGTSPYQYALGNGSFSNNATFDPLSAGTYTFHIKDTNSCEADTTISISDSLTVTANYIVSDALCADSASGSITTTGAGGTSPYKYAIGAGAFGTTNTFNGLGNGSYTIRIKDSFGCKKDTSLLIDDPLPIALNVGITDPLCNNDTNGIVSLTANGGTSPYQYAIGSGSYTNSNTFNNLSSGNYLVKVKDTNNCYKDTTVEVKDPTEVQQSFTLTNNKCFGDTTGIIVVAGIGGKTPYTYAINTGSYSSSNTFNSLTAGSYTIYTKDSNGCVKDSIVSLAQPDKLKPLANVKQSTCEGLNDGKVVLAATGGVTSYQYAIGSGSYTSNATFDPLATGTYIFHIKDSNDCEADTTIAIADSLIINANYSVTDALCADSTSGWISVSPSGGANPYQYAIGSGTYQSSNTFTGLGSGNYVVHVKDSFGCQKDTNITVNEPAEVKLSANIIHPQCNSDSNGVINVSGSGGTAPYQYAIGNNSYGSNNIFANLYEGTFAIKLKDSNNCYKDTSITLLSPDELIFTLNIKDVLCFGESTGSVTVNGTGGTPAYTYSIDASPFQSNNTLTGINAGMHGVKMRDNKGCIKDTNILVTEPSELFINELDITNPTCEGMSDGAINIVGTGGTPAYTYSVDGNSFSTNSTIISLQEGRYTVVVKDQNNCEADSLVDLQGYPHTLLDEVGITPVTCFGFSDGKLEVQASGGTPPFRYQLNSEALADTAIFLNLITGSYAITVVDSFGCEKDTSIHLPSPEKLAIKTLVTPNDCDGRDNSGVITANVVGGTEPYSYRWNTVGSESTNSITGMPNGIYKVNVTDLNNCSDSAEANIEYDDCCLVFIPDAFTPNNDGLNDIIRVLAKGEFTLINFSIYNRFGERVFVTDNIEEGWNGIYKGTLQDLGTYYYYVKGICGYSRKSKVFYKGSITLIH